MEYSDVCTTVNRWLAPYVYWRDSYAQFNKLVALYHLGDYQSAITIYESIEAQLPARMLWYQIEPILAYYQANQYDEVLFISQNILDAQNRAFSELYWLRGKIFEERGQASEAATAFELAEQYNPSPYWKQNLP